MTSWILVWAAALLGGILLWGLISPRTQWRVLVGWSTSDPDRSEPGDGVHGLTRLICLLGLLGLAAFGVVQVWSAISHRPQPGVPPNAIERMWGTPVPRLVDRLVVPGGVVPAELAPGEVLGFQEIERGWAPDYLVSMERWAFLGEPEPAGVLGVYPGDGYTAYGISDVLLEARGSLRCIPRAVTVVEEENEIRVGVFWGLPGAPTADNVTACVADGTVRQRVLIPVQLAGPIDGRAVVTFEGVPVPPVPVLDD